MKWAILLFLINFNLWAKPLVLVGYFDAFDKAPFNNSQRVAQNLQATFKDSSELDLILCPLSTVYDKSFGQLENCLKSLTTQPNLILGLGETGCRLKIELLARNRDKTKGPDNEGNERYNSEIIPEGPKALGLTYPLPDMYCSIPAKDRKAVEVSNNAGTFVCNNLAYQFIYHYPELSFGFIHVPANNCRGLDAKTNNSSMWLEKMILTAVKISDFGPLPTTKDELESLRKTNKNHQCLKEFYMRAKGIDEKGIWPF